jgi:DNA (cytosine-5)-methyltransferase 1
MKHGSLFSGIGGFDLAAEWMGWENVFHCEWNTFGQKVLKHYWPKAESFNDITKSDFTKYANTIDIISGGFPCQPYSSAGQRKGKEDERHLWPHMLRAIQEISPRYIVGENVRGLLNWNGGMVFEEVCIDLENNGYQVAPVVIPACGVGAPHRRERIWFVAANAQFKSERGDGGTNNERQTNLWGQNTGDVFGTFCGDGVTTNPVNEGLQRGEFNGTFERGKRNGDESHDTIAKLYQISHWDEFPTEPPVCGRNDGIPRELDGITFPKWRTESIKGYGNAIVPQVAFEIFKAIQQCDDTML